MPRNVYYTATFCNMSQWKTEVKSRKVLKASAVTVQKTQRDDPVEKIIGRASDVTTVYPRQKGVMGGGGGGHGDCWAPARRSRLRVRQADGRAAATTTIRPSNFVDRNNNIVFFVLRIGRPRGIR